MPEIKGGKLMEQEKESTLLLRQINEKLGVIVDILQPQRLENTNTITSDQIIAYIKDNKQHIADVLQKNLPKLKEAKPMEQKNNAPAVNSDANQMRSFSCCMKCEAVKNEIKKIVDAAISESWLEARRIQIINNLNRKLEQDLASSLSYDLDSESLSPFRTYIIELLNDKFKIEISVRG